MSRHKVSRGNTSDLIGMFNKKSVIEAPPVGVLNKKSQIEAPPVGMFTKKNQIEAPSSGGGGLLSVSTGALGISHKFRKTSAFVPTTTKIVNKDDVKFRKSSAMVLMPTVTLTEDSSNQNRSLNVDDKLPEFKPLKNVSGLENGSTELPKLRSALKLSTVNAPKIQTTETSLDTNNNQKDRRGSVGLGRSKSVCHKVKFEPPQVQVGDSANEGHGRPSTINKTFAKFQQMDNKQSQLSPDSSRLTRQNSLPSLNERKVSAPPPSTSPSILSVGSGGGVRRSTVVARSPSSAKEVILSWVQERVNTYPNLNVTNFSSSWNDGMAFCALIHYYYPEAFEYDKLEKENRRYNFDLAFRAAEHFADICPLLDVEDMIIFEKPDWKCVFTYVQTFFRRFRNGRDPPVPTKKLTLTPPHIYTPAPTINLGKSIE